jgi:hypothetical protein
VIPYEQRKSVVAERARDAAMRQAVASVSVKAKPSGLGWPTSPPQRVLQLLADPNRAGAPTMTGRDAMAALDRSDLLYRSMLAGSFL